MIEYALGPLCQAFGDDDWEKTVRAFGHEILNATQKYFWSQKHGLFINNLPWLAEEKETRLCDRSLATAILFDQCPGGNVDPALKALTECPPEMGFSYPANAGWRLWALAKGGRMESILRDLRNRWGKMESVTQNNTLQEDWHAEPDSNAQWSHCPVVPLYILYTSIVGIRPLEPAFKRFQIRAQLADLEQIDLIAHTIKGPIIFKSNGLIGNRRIYIKIPQKCEGELVIDHKEKVDLVECPGAKILGTKHYLLPGGSEVQLRLKYT